MVRELCRHIRGMAMNYPQGLTELRRELDAATNGEGMNTYAVLQDLVKRVEALEAKGTASNEREPAWPTPAKVTVTETVAGEVSGAGTETETGAGGTSAAPKEQGHTQGEKRKPGRPRKQVQG